MTKATPNTGSPVQFNWLFYALLGLATGPLIYALQHGNGLAAIGYGALCALWYAYGLKSRKLATCLYALEALVHASEELYRQLKAAPRPSLPAPDAPRGGAP